MTTAATSTLNPVCPYITPPIVIDNPDFQTLNHPGSNNEDCFVGESPEASPRESIQLPWHSRVLNRVVHTARTIWMGIRRYNPFTQIFNLIENARANPHVRRAESRNGATTNDEIRRYHESILFNPSSPDENAIFRYHFSNTNQSRPLIVLALGNSQTHMTPENTAGVNRLFNRFRDAGHNVVIFRTGCVSNELNGRFLGGGNLGLHPRVVETHMRNVLEDIINGRGLFAGFARPTQVAFAGYSFGGGCIDNVIRKWNSIGGNIPVSSTAYIDPIQHGACNLASPVESRPNHSRRHCLFYQNNSIAVCGRHSPQIRNGDISLEVPSTYHETIDDNPMVQQRVFDFITSSFR